MFNCPGTKNLEINNRLFIPYSVPTINGNASQIIIIHAVKAPTIPFFTSKTIETKKIEFVNQYSGIDLNSKNFNRTQMTDKENKAYDELLEIMYLENMDIAISEGYSAPEADLFRHL